MTHYFNSYLKNLFHEDNKTFNPNNDNEEKIDLDIFIYNPTNTVEFIAKLNLDANNKGLPLGHDASRKWEDFSHIQEIDIQNYGPNSNRYLLCLSSNIDYFRRSKPIIFPPSEMKCYIEFEVTNKNLFSQSTNEKLKRTEIDVVDLRGCEPFSVIVTNIITRKYENTVINPISIYFFRVLFYYLLEIFKDYIPMPKVPPRIEVAYSKIYLETISFVWNSNYIERVGKEALVKFANNYWNISEIDFENNNNDDDVLFNLYENMLNFYGESQNIEPLWKMFESTNKFNNIVFTIPIYPSTVFERLIQHNADFLGTSEWHKIVEKILVERKHFIPKFKFWPSNLFQELHTHTTLSNSDTLFFLSFIENKITDILYEINGYLNRNNECKSNFSVKYVSHFINQYNQDSIHEEEKKNLRAFYDEANLEAESLLMAQGENKEIYFGTDDLEKDFLIYIWDSVEEKIAAIGTFKFKDLEDDNPDHINISLSHHRFFFAKRTKHSLCTSGKKMLSLTNLYTLDQYTSEELGRLLMNRDFYGGRESVGMATLCVFTIFKIANVLKDNFNIRGIFTSAASEGTKKIVYEYGLVHSKKFTNKIHRMEDDVRKSQMLELPFKEVIKDVKVKMSEIILKEDKETYLSLVADLLCIRKLSKAKGEKFLLDSFYDENEEQTRFHNGIFIRKLIQDKSIILMDAITNYFNKILSLKTLDLNRTDAAYNFEPYLYVTKYYHQLYHHYITKHGTFGNNSTRVFPIYLILFDLKVAREIYNREIDRITGILQACSTKYQMNPKKRLHSKEGETNYSKMPSRDFNPEINNNINFQCRICKNVTDLMDSKLYVPICNRTCQEKLWKKYT